MSALIERVKQRARAEAWLIDAARRHPRSRRIRLAIEQQRSRRLVADAGSADAALDRIVARAIERGTASDTPRTT